MKTISLYHAEWILTTLLMYSAFIFITKSYKIQKLEQLKKSYVFLHFLFASCRAKALTYKTSPDYFFGLYG